MATAHLLDTYITASVLVRIIGGMLDLSENGRSFEMCGNHQKRALRRSASKTSDKPNTIAPTFVNSQTGNENQF